MADTQKDRRYAMEVGMRLREIRKQQGLSLQGVEIRSNGKTKVAALGSYERGDRMVTVIQLAELANLYRVPTSVLLPQHDRSAAGKQQSRIVLDLQKLAEAPAEASTLARWVEHIRRQRGDYAGRMLSIRYGDLEALAAIYDTSPYELVALLRSWHVLHPSSSELGATDGGEGLISQSSEDVEVCPRPSGSAVLPPQG
ncbi:MULTISPECIES: transcriptional regulator [Parafrankia]|uniref:transcriptional regulator n=1 Tax=Parafrankia TaxID=2994362 RepID=UPI000DF28143|nr:MULTISPECIES: transcriptional regulator [Parafrankia]MBE3206686.1 transcriptional regulator [Parafrankia sp. CH37]